LNRAMENRARPSIPLGDEKTGSAAGFLSPRGIEPLLAG
jgi:hypothetical protein